MNKLVLIGLSAAFVGFVHSLGPAHWIPVLLLARSRRWNIQTALFGAWVTGLGHILFTLIVAFGVAGLGSELLERYGQRFERLSGLMMVIFGVGLAAYALWNHRRCIGHSHHGPKPDQKTNKPMWLLFLIGFTPCVAVLPSFVSLSALDMPFLTSFLVTALFFAGGVWSSLGMSTYLTFKGLMKLDHPLLEHYGDIIAGLGIALVGALLIFFGHDHAVHSGHIH